MREDKRTSLCFSALCFLALYISVNYERMRRENERRRAATTQRRKNARQRRQQWRNVLRWQRDLNRIIGTAQRKSDIFVLYGICIRLGFCFALLLLTNLWCLLTEWTKWRTKKVGKRWRFNFSIFVEINDKYCTVIVLLMRIAN